MSFYDPKDGTVWILVSASSEEAFIRLKQTSHSGLQLEREGLSCLDWPSNGINRDNVGSNRDNVGSLRNCTCIRPAKMTHSSAQVGGTGSL